MEDASEICEIPSSVTINRVRAEALDIERRVADQDALYAAAAAAHEAWARDQIAVDERYSDAFLHEEDALVEMNAMKTARYEDAVERTDRERRAVEGYEAKYREMEAQVQALREQLNALPAEEGEALRELQEGRERLDSIVMCTLVFRDVCSSSSKWYLTACFLSLSNRRGQASESGGNEGAHRPNRPLQPRDGL